MTDTLMRTLVGFVEFLISSLHKALKWDPIAFGPLFPVRFASIS